jgi:MFS family permease
MFASLRERDFRLLWLSNLAATFSMHMQVVARGWLIYDMTGSPLKLTWVMLSFMLPSVLFSLAGGLLADRLQKKWVMVGGQLLNACATALLAGIVHGGHVTFWHFIGFGVFNGTVMAISMPSRMAMVPEVVGRDSVVNAMALQSATFNLARILGPVLAGMLLAGMQGAGLPAARAVGVVFFVIAALSLLAVLATAQLHYRGAPAAGSRDRGMLADVAEALRYARDDRLVPGLLVMGVLPMTFGFTATFLLPAYNKDVLHGGPDDLGLLTAAMGSGALLGSLALARHGHAGARGRLMFALGYAWALCLGAFALSGNLLLSLLAGALTGLCGALVGSLNMAVTQLAVREEIRGRVLSIMMMSHGLQPLFVIPVSLLAEVAGIDVALLLSAVLLAASMAWIARAFPALRTLDTGDGGRSGAAG